MRQTLQIKKVLFFAVLLLPLSMMAQTISGKVTDALNEPIPFANVIEKGTANGTTADENGDFSLNVTSIPTTIVVSSLGYTTKEVQVTNETDLVNVSLEEDAVGLDEVVVTGLASSVKRANLANAVSTVSAEDLVGKTAQATVDGALYGKLTGVNIVASSGAPGGGNAVRLRGTSSINGNNQPLYIVDGVYINNVEIPSGLRFASGANRGNEENAPNRVADIDPNDIESIEVLKGASAAAIYGTRANAGVIIITTKRGKAGKARISFSQDLGFNTISNRLGMRPWTADSVESTFNAAERVLYEQAVASGGLIDYEDEIYGEKGFITESKISVTGGNEKTKFYVGSSFRDEDGIIKNTGYDRFSIRANIDHKISNTFEFSSSSSYTRSNSSRSFTGNENEGGLSYGYTLAFTRPWINLFPDEQGNYPDNPNASGNPILVRDLAKNEDATNRFIQAVKFNVNLLNDDTNRIRLQFNGGLDYLANETYVYVPEIHQAQRGNQDGFIAQGKNNFTNFNYTAAAVWNHDAMGGDLGITTQAGITYLEQDANLVLGQGTNLIPNQTNLTQASSQEITQETYEIKEFGYFGQVEGNYKDRIIATLGYRFDKSTLNGDQNKFYGFPRASVAFNLNNFDFWDSESISRLKIRAAYGETGSSAEFGSLFTSLDFVGIGGLGGSTINPEKGDPDIEPETSSEFETGFDITLFDKVNFEATYYNRKVKDLILSRSLPSSSGFTTETTNLGDLVNQGLELSLSIDAFNKENFQWSTGVQFWFNRSEITRLDVPAFPQPGAGFGLGLGTFYIQEGQPVTQLVGNINNVPTQIGDVEPDFQMSFNNQITFLKQFDFSFLLHWKNGGENINLSKLLTDLGGTTPDLETPEGQTRAGLGFVPTRFIEPAGYLRMREIALYYRIPKSKIGWFDDAIEGIKLGISARNLFTITDYTSYDPETSVNGGAGLSSGIEVTPFPSSQQFYFHLNVNF